MATAAVLANRRALRAATKEHQKSIRARALSDIRSEISGVLERKRHAMQSVRAGCARARERLRASVKARRASARAALNAEIDSLRAEGRAKCRARRALVTAGGKTAASRKRAALREARKEAAFLRRLERARGDEHKRRAALERRAESDDEVRGNLEPDMVPIFDAVRRKISARAGASRTEAFLHWVHEHASEVWALRERQAHAKLRALLGEERRAAAELRKCGGQCSAKKRRASLAAAPF
jgi:hypothetical protein